MATGTHSARILVNTFPPKVEILSTYTKDGETFSFDPTTDDIEEYIRDVKEAAKQLGHER